MGCGNTKNQVNVEASEKPAEKSSKKDSSAEEKVDHIEEDKSPRSLSSSPFRRRPGSTENGRQTSAISAGKVSIHSADSGYGGGERPKQPPRSAEEDIAHEQKILENLQKQGFLAQPVVRTGGLAFEVDASQNSNNKMGLPPLAPPPARLAKLQKKRRRRKRTADDIAAKLAQAEARRKESEAAKVETARLAQLRAAEANGGAAPAQLEPISQDALDATQHAAEEKRLEKLRLLQNRMEQKRAHAEQVRMRKKMLAQDGTTEAEVIETRDLIAHDGQQ